MGKRMLAIGLVLCLCLGFLSTGALAREPDDQTEWKQAPAVSVRTEAELAAALPDGESEPDENNIVWIPVAELAADVTVTGELGTLGKLIVPQGRTLTVNEGGSVTAEVEIKSGGAVNVHTGGTLATTMAGEYAIHNYGTIQIDKGAQLISQFGGSVVNEAGATLTMNGLFTCNGYVDQEGGVHTWFSNKGTLTGSGQLVIPKLAFADSLANRRTSAENASVYCVGSDVTVFVSAFDFSELSALAREGTVKGIFLTTEEQNGVDLLTTESLDLTGKKLIVDRGVSLFLAAGTTLKADSLTDLLYNGRRSTIRIRAGGGTLSLGGIPVISGDAAADAVFTVTEGLMFTGGAQWQTALPITDNRDKWYYIPESAAVSAKGELTESTCLPLMVDGTLNVKEDFTTPGQAEIRGTLTEDGGKASVASLGFSWSSTESAVKGTAETYFELAFDLNQGSEDAYEDIFDHLAINDGVCYLQADGNQVPVTPTREGFTFAGWKALSPWPGVTEEQLASFRVLRAEGDSSETGWYVKWPAEFPVRMEAQWEKNTHSQPVDPGYYPATQPAAAAQPEAEETAVTVSVSGGAELAAEISGGTVTLKDEGLDLIPSQETGALTIDLNGIEGDVTELVIPAGMVEKAAEAAEAGGAGLELRLPAGTVKLNAAALAEAAEAKGDVSVSVKAGEDGSTTVNVTVGGEPVETKLIVELPVPEEGQVLVLVNADGSEKVIKKSLVQDGTAYAELPAGAAVKAAKVEASYPDVAEDHPYADAVRFAAGHELFRGTDRGFEPETPMNRAMLTTVLYRLEDAAAVGGSVFDDVAEGAWYADAVAWAAEAGIVQGTGNGFSPNEPVTREQMAVILCRYAGMLGLDTEGRAPLDGFADSSSVAPWADDAMGWAIGVGLLDAVEGSSLDPQGSVSRGEVAAILQRMVGLILK
jgi:hypothetical protein